MRAAHILLSSGFSIRNCLASFRRVTVSFQFMIMMIINNEIVDVVKCVVLMEWKLNCEKTNFAFRRTLLSPTRGERLESAEVSERLADD